jgi:hypothetical protein
MYYNGTPVFCQSAVPEPEGPAVRREKGAPGPLACKNGGCKLHFRAEFVMM